MKKLIFILLCLPLIFSTYKKLEIMKSKLFLIALIIGFTFTSCKKCKDCTMEWEPINGHTEETINQIYEIEGVGFTISENIEENHRPNMPSGEYCESALEHKETIDYNGGYAGYGDLYRVYYDCK
jgi:hypothetical protein